MESVAGTVIREFMAGKGLKQKRLAELLGMDRTAVNRRITGRTSLDASEHEMFAKALGVSTAEFSRRIFEENLRRIEAADRDAAGVASRGNVLYQGPVDVRWKIPFAGRVNAGDAATSPGRRNDSNIAIEPDCYTDEPGLLATEVSGFSMVPALFEGDIVICAIVAPGAWRRVRAGSIVCVWFEPTAGRGVEPIFARWFTTDGRRIILHKDYAQRDGVECDAAEIRQVAEFRQLRRNRM